MKRQSTPPGGVAGRLRRIARRSVLGADRCNPLGRVPRCVAIRTSTPACGRHPSLRVGRSWPNMRRPIPRSKLRLDVFGLPRLPTGCRAHYFVHDGRRRRTCGCPWTPAAGPSSNDDRGTGCPDTAAVPDVRSGQAPPSAICRQHPTAEPASRPPPTRRCGRLRPCSGWSALPDRPDGHCRSPAGVRCYRKRSPGRRPLLGCSHRRKARPSWRPGAGAAARAHRSRDAHDETHCSPSSCATNAAQHCYGTR